MPYKRKDGHHPIFGNYHDLFDDVDCQIAGMKNPDLKRAYALYKPEIVSKGTLTSQPNLIETTYNNLAGNLELDLNQMFEESLQYEIERSLYFKSVLDKGVELIHKYGGIESTKDLKPGNNWKQVRKQYMRDKVKNDLLALHVNETKFTSDQVDMHLKNAGWDVDNLLKDALKEKYSEVQKALKSKYSAESKAYYNLKWCSKFLKMLDEQYPYFGGSTEYENNEKWKYEYYIYHLSTLTRDPSQMYPIESPHSSLLKPMLAYNTHRSSPVPYQNQMNLGCGVTEASWDSLSLRFQETIINNLLDVKDQSGVHSGKLHKEELTGSGWKDMDKRILRMKEILKTNKNIERQTLETKLAFRHQVRDVWNQLAEGKRKALYGDVSKVPWSSAHIYEGEMDEPKNVVGVKGNILLAPVDAAERYVDKLKLQFGDKIPDGVYPNKKSVTFTDIRENFIGHHQKWYTNAYENKLPIVAGISGHTLGYLNLYSTALKNATMSKENTNDYPSLEEFRFAIIGALVGNKQHHSYCEAMTASEGIPDTFNVNGKTEGELSYKDRNSYADVVDSTNLQIKSVAVTAKASVIAAIEEIKGTNVPQNTVVGKMIAGFSIAENERSELLGACIDYVNTIGTPQEHATADKRLIGITEKCIEKAKLKLQHYKNGVPTMKGRGTVIDKITNGDRIFKKKQQNITGKIGHEDHVPIKRSGGPTP